VSNNPVLIALWRDVVPTIAFRHPFLLQVLLATAAQHKIHEATTPSPALSEAATYYYQEGLATYITQLNNISESNCEALFCFSQIVVCLSYSRLILAPKLILPEFIGIMDLLRGTFTIAAKASIWLEQGPLAPMLEKYPHTVPAHAMIPDSPGLKAFHVLHESVRRTAGASAEEAEKAKVLVSTIELVYALLIGDMKDQDALNQVVGLPIWIDPQFSRMLRARDGAALAVLAYYGVALSCIDSVWFYRGLGKLLVEAIAETVPDEWAQHLRWPLSEVTRKSGSESLSASSNEVQEA
jgi:hypothetical protein